MTVNHDITRKVMKFGVFINAHWHARTCWVRRGAQSYQCLIWSLQSKFSGESSWSSSSWSWEGKISAGGKLYIHSIKAEVSIHYWGKTISPWQAATSVSGRSDEETISSVFVLISWIVGWLRWTSAARLRAASTFSTSHMLAPAQSMEKMAFWRRRRSRRKLMNWASGSSFHSSTLKRSSMWCWS